MMVVLLFELSHSFRTKKIESHNSLCKNKGFRGVVMPFEDTDILEFNQYWNFDKAPSIIDVDLEFLIKVG